MGACLLMYLARFTTPPTAGDYWAGSYRWLTLLPGPVLREFFTRSPVHRLVASHLPREGRVLDAGCGFGVLSLLNPHSTCRIAGIDCSPDLITTADRFCPDSLFCAGLLSSLPYRSECFDAYFAVSSWELNRDGLPAEEACRVLRKGGRLVVACPRPPFRFLTRSPLEIETTMGRLMLDPVSAPVPSNSGAWQTDAYGYYYSASELKRAISRAGFRDIDVVHSDLGGGLMYSTFPGPLLRSRLRRMTDRVALETNEHSNSWSDRFLGELLLDEGSGSSLRFLRQTLGKFWSFWNVILAAKG